MSDDEPLTAQPPAPDRLKALGYAGRSPRLKPAILRELTPKMHQLIDVMVNGTDLPAVRNLTREVEDVHPETGERIKVVRALEPGMPLRLDEAADLLRIRRRQARDLFGQALFQKELSRTLQALRDGHKIEAVHRQIEIMRDPGQGKAADRKVSLEAADRLLERDGDRRQGVTVNVGVAAQITPGYVIRLPAKREPVTLEGNAIEVKPEPPAIEPPEPPRPPAIEQPEPPDFASRMRATIAAEGRRAVDHEPPIDQPLAEPATTTRDRAEAARVERRDQAIRDGRGVEEERRPL